MDYRAQSILLLTALLCGACGKAEDASPGSDSLSEEEFGREFTDLSCGGQKACCEQGSHPFDEAKCRSQTTSQLSKQHEITSRAGQSFDPLFGSQCLDLFRRASATCKEASDQEIEACTSLFHGTKQQGEACQEGDCGRSPDGVLLQCAIPTPPSDAGSTCQPVSALVAQEGPPGKLGDACKFTCTTDSYSGIECSTSGGSSDVPTNCYTNDGLYCDGQHCAALIPQGGVCTSPKGCVAGSHCTVDHLCPTAAGCSDPGVCEANPGPGSPCQSPLDCGAGAFYCEATSQQCAARKSAGEACSADSQKCGTLPCKNADLECSSGHCEKGVCLEPGSLSTAEKCETK